MSTPKEFFLQLLEPLAKFESSFKNRLMTAGYSVPEVPLPAESLLTMARTLPEILPPPPAPPAPPVEEEAVEEALLPPVAPPLEETEYLG